MVSRVWAWFGLGFCSHPLSIHSGQKRSILITITVYHTVTAWRDASGVQRTTLPVSNHHLLLLELLELLLHLLLLVGHRGGGIIVGGHHFKRSLIRTTAQVSGNDLYKQNRYVTCHKGMNTRATSDSLRRINYIFTPCHKRRTVLCTLFLQRDFVVRPSRSLVARTYP